MPSSVIRAMHYDPGSKTLRVIFLSGAIYDYKEVPERVYENMKAAPSKGIFLNREIKGRYDFEQIG
jgi:hypothetical protein